MGDHKYTPETLAAVGMAIPDGPPKYDADGVLIPPPWRGMVAIVDEEAEAMERDYEDTSRDQVFIEDYVRTIDRMARGEFPLPVTRQGEPIHAVATQVLRRLAQMDQDIEFPDPKSFVTGAAFEAEPDVEPDWWMDGGLFQVGTSAEEGDVATVITFTGSAGAGKSTLLGDLIRCGCDNDRWGGDLFGSEITMPADGVVMWSNLEMSRSLLRSRFLRPLRIVNKQRYVPMTLQVTVPIMTDDGRAWWVEALSHARTHTWVVDSYSILTSSSVESENSNGDNTRAIQRLREIATEAGVKVVVLIDHTGWVATDRMRGASSKKDRIDEMFSYELVDSADLKGLRTLTHVKSRWSEGGTTAHVEWDPMTRRHVFTPGSKAEAAALRKESKAAEAAEAKKDKARESRDHLVKEVARRVVEGLPPIKNQKELQALVGGKTDFAAKIRTGLIEAGVLEDTNAGCVPNLDNEELAEGIARLRRIKDADADPFS